MGQFVYKVYSGFKFVQYLQLLRIFMIKFRMGLSSYILVGQVRQLHVVADL